MRTTFSLFIALLASPLFSHAQLTLVQDIEPGFYSSVPSRKVVFKDKLVFYANTSTGNWQLWSYNDTTVSKVALIKASVTSNSMVVADGKLYFGAWDASGAGYELHMWDGINSPAMVKDINIGTDDSNPTNLVTFNNKVYFCARTGTHGTELWMYDPVSNVTSRLSDINPGAASSHPLHLTVFNNKIYFSANDNTPGVRKLYMYDPLSGTLQIAPGYNVTTCASPKYLNVCYNKLYFSATSSAYGQELYAYDGNSAPVRISDINIGSGNSMDDVGMNEVYAPSAIIGYKGFVYFTAGIPNVLQLYKYDPNAPIHDINNPKLVYNINPVNIFNWVHTEFVEFDNKLFFSGDDSTHRTELWIYDGVNNPMMVADINTGAGHGNPKHFAVYKDNLYFTATGKTIGSELYKLGKNGLHIKNVSIVNNIRVYPVPASDIIHFEIELKTACAFTITLTDITGRDVFTSGMHSYQLGSATIQADLSQFAGGNYYYRIITGDGKVLGSGKVLKQL